MDKRTYETLSFQIQRNITLIYKTFLNIIEDIKADHEEMLNKLDLHLPTEYHNLVEASDSLSEDKFSHLRKRVLDVGNEAIREINRQVDFLKHKEEGI